MQLNHRGLTSCMHIFPTNNQVSASLALYTLAFSRSHNICVTRDDFDSLLAAIAISGISTAWTRVARRRDQLFCVHSQIYLPPFTALDLTSEL